MNGYYTRKGRELQGADDTDSKKRSRTHRQQERSHGRVLARIAHREVEEHHADGSEDPVERAEARAHLELGHRGCRRCFASARVGLTLGPAANGSRSGLQLGFFSWKRKKILQLQQRKAPAPQQRAKRESEKIQRHPQKAQRFLCRPAGCSGLLARNQAAIFALECGIPRMELPDPSTAVRRLPAFDHQATRPFAARRRRRRRWRRGRGRWIVKGAEEQTPCFCLFLIK